MELCVVDLHKAFGGVAALDGCSFTCAASTITGLVGPNGSGKSTVFNTVTGIIQPDSGEITLGLERLTRRRPNEIARAGIGRTFQTTRLFRSLTVLENVMLGAPPSAALTHTLEQAHLLLKRFGIGALVERKADALSFGQQRLVELARAMVGRPRFILLDEPFAGLSPAMAAELAAHVAGLPGAGIGVMLIEHDLSMVMQLCPRILVLHQGKLIADGSPAEIRRDKMVIGCYLGETVAAET
jgi:ABC-type branched-subunit amino acid transport system ATPase component